MAVFGDAGACPLGEQARVERPVLPWTLREVRPTPLRLAPAIPVLVVERTGGDGAALLRVLRRTRMRCGTGTGELVVVVIAGRTTATVRGLAPAVATCVKQTVEEARVRGIDDAFARVAIELR